MRKLLLTFILFSIVLLARAVTATIYVKAESAPYLYSWYNANNQAVQPLGVWPGALMEETEVVRGDSFWKMSISTPEDVTSFNIIFNNGSGGQTADIVGLSSNRYYTYDGNTGYTDISKDYGTVPNAEISQVEIRGDFNDLLEGSATSLMTKGEGHVYTMTLNLSNTKTDQTFRLVINGSIYGDIISKLIIDAPSGWIEKQGNYCILHHSITDYKTYTITAIWEENVEAFEGWTLKVEGKDYLYDTINPTDWAKLQAIYYNSMGNGAGWNKPWDFSHNDYTTKYLPGVSAHEGNVVSIDLSENGLTGQFPVALTILPYLESLNLSGNVLSGDIGMVMAAYVKTNPTVQIALKDINISNNQFTGNIGLFAACLPNLQTLDASHNCLEDVYPTISPNVTSLNIGQQTISRIVDLELSNLTVEAMAEKMPSILLYNHAQQTFIPEMNILCTTGELTDYLSNWSIILSYKNGKATVPYSSTANVYYGESGDVLNVGIVNDKGTLEGTTFRIRLLFDEGDCNFDGQVNVLDVQTDVNFIFDSYKNRPYNFTAANLWKDEQINVQDIVVLINRLFESEATSANNAPRRSSTTEFGLAEAVVFCRDGQLFVNSTRPVASFDIVLAGCSDIALDAIRKSGFVCESRPVAGGVRLIGYSLSGDTLPSGETLIGQLTGEGFVAHCMMADSEATEILSIMNDGDITGVSVPHNAIMNNEEVYRLQLGSDHAISIDRYGKKTMINNIKQ